MIAILYVVVTCAILGVVAGIIRVFVQSDEKLAAHFKKRQKRYKTIGGLIMIAAFLWLAYSQGWIQQRDCTSRDRYVCNE